MLVWVGAAWVCTEGRIELYPRVLHVKKLLHIIECKLSRVEPINDNEQCKIQSQPLECVCVGITRQKVPGAPRGGGCTKA